MAIGGSIKISIVTNAFNQGRFLADALQSVLTQGWQELEYLVVDPGSTDNTAEIIHDFQQRYPGRIVHIVERDKGPADGLNKAFAKATGEIFGYLNADDYYLPGCFREAVQAVNNFPNGVFKMFINPRPVIIITEFKNPSIKEKCSA